MHHPPFSVSLHGGQSDLRERWTPLFEQYEVTAVFSGHDHVYTRAEHHDVHYFITGGGGAPLYPRRPRSNPIDVAAVKKFERVLHYLRVTVTGNRLEVTAIRADGTIIETTTWTDGPEPKVERPMIAQAGAPKKAPAVAAAAAPPTPDSSKSTLWVGLVGLVLALGTAVFVVRSLRS